MSVYIIQCLCPQRHCILALAYEAGEQNTQRLADLQAAVGKMIATGEIDPWCGICQSRERTYETAKTRFRTMEEAMGPLSENAKQQALTRNFFKQSRN